MRRRFDSSSVSAVFSNSVSAFFALGIWLALFAASAQAARAQSSIFNAPSTDVLPPHTLYVEADYAAHLSSYEKGGFNFFGPSLIYGLRKQVEVGVNAYFTNSSGPTAAELQPNAKWQFYSDEGRGLAATAGGVLFVPLARSDEAHTSAMLYATISKQLKARLGPRAAADARALHVGLHRRRDTAPRRPRPRHRAHRKALHDRSPHQQDS